MTEPLFESSGPVERPGGGGLAGAIGPEAVAALLAIIVVVALVGARFVNLGGEVAAGTPAPSENATGVPTRTASAFDVPAAQNLLIVNQNLYRFGRALQRELDPPAGVNTGVVQSTFANMKGQIGFGLSQAGILARSPVGAPVATPLLEVYTRLDAIIESTNNISTAVVPPWQKAAQDVVDQLALLPPLDDQLTALLATPANPSPSEVASGVPSPTAQPSQSATPSATAVSTPPPTAPPSAPPSAPASAPPSGIPTAPPGPNQVQNPGFEDGVLPPAWTVVELGTASAIPSSDTANPHSGKASARIDIFDPGLFRTQISLQQHGLSIQPGAYYQVSVALRASAPRDVLVRIASPSGQSLGTGQSVPAIGPNWTVVTFPLTSIIPSDDAIFAIDVGGSAVTVWVDDVSVTRLNAGP